MGSYYIPAVFHDGPSPTMSSLGAVCSAHSCTPASADAMYRSIFPPDTIQARRTDGQRDPDGHAGNPLVLIKRKGASQVKRILFNDYIWLDCWRQVLGFQHVFMGGLTYLGKSRRLDNAVAMHSMIFDIDYVTEKGLETLFYQAQTGVIPLPNYIVFSGNGIHAYYVFDEPVPLYHGSFGRRVKSQVKLLKHHLTTLLWNPYIVGEEASKNVQYQSINQCFRLVGSYTKSLDMEHNRYTVIAYKTPAKPYDIEELYRYVTFADIPKEDRYLGRSIRGLDYWREHAPDWFERRIINGDRTVKYWHIGRGLYDWWVRQVREKARFGHRYHCLFCTVVFAIKCDIDYEELKTDLYSFLPRFAELKPDDPITEDDVAEALASYDIRLNTYPANSIEFLSGIEFERRRRNGRPQKVHLEIARATQKVLDPEGKWRNTDGAPTKEEIVRAWQTKNPGRKKADCIRETGLSRPTVMKWWQENLGKESNSELLGCPSDAWEKNGQTRWTMDGKGVEVYREGRWKKGE